MDYTRKPKQHPKLVKGVDVDRPWDSPVLRPSPTPPPSPSPRPSPSPSPQTPADDAMEQAGKLKKRNNSIEYFLRGMGILK